MACSKVQLLHRCMLMHVQCDGTGHTHKYRDVCKETVRSWEHHQERSSSRSPDSSRESIINRPIRSSYDSSRAGRKMTDARYHGMQ